MCVCVCVCVCCPSVCIECAHFLMCCVVTLTQYTEDSSTFSTTEMLFVVYSASEIINLLGVGVGVRKIKTKQNERNSSRNHVEKNLTPTIENDLSVSNVAEICLHGTTCQRSRECSVDSFTRSVLKPQRWS